MTQTDLPGVWAIEQTLPGAWSYEQLKEELRLAHGWHLVIRLPGSTEAESACSPALEKEHPPRQTDAISARHHILGYIFGTTVLDEAEIRKIAVAPAYRRRGIASRLLSAVDQLLVSSSVKECFLELRAANTIALDLYLKNGFQIIGQRKNYYTMPADDAILVKKTYNYSDRSVDQTVACTPQ